MNKIPVAVLGATGMVGQRFVQLLQDHPVFEIAALAASERNVGKTYTEACQWVLDEDMPSSVAGMIVQPIEPVGPAKIVFSALPSDIAHKAEPGFAQAGYQVCSNASAYRQEPDVPLLIPEVNAEHIVLVERQRQLRGWQGCIVTSPNCTTTPLVMALKPLDLAFGVNRLFVTTMQAVSGGGYPGIPFLQITDNILPNIEGEEEKIEIETRLLLGKISENSQVTKDMLVSVQTNRVPIADGHMVSLSVGFDRKSSVEEAIRVLSEYRGSELVRGLQSAPEVPLIVRREDDRPQSRKDRNAGRGMAVSVGRIRSCSILDLRLVAVAHNAIRGAAGGAILNAELLVDGGYVQ
jgi:aspartate-semialdehyde dehydrogenase